MSSDEETPSPPAGSHLSLKMRSRRVQRSCDICRQRKIRCDGSKMPDGQCSNCLAFRSICTYVRPTKKRGPKNQLVEELKQKTAALEAQLRSVSVCSLCAQPLRSQPGQEASSTSASVFTPASSDHSSPAEPPLAEQDAFLHVELVDRFSTLCIHEQADKYFGSASSFVLVGNAIAEKEKYLGRPVPTLTARRRIFWQTLPWEKEEYEKRPNYVYPSSDLIASLLELYFTNVHPIFPLLHRPSFERSVAERLHLKDPEFGGTLLAVLGVASRYSNDPRVFVDGGASLSSGWKFVNQLEVARKLFQPTLSEIQVYGLMTLYYLGDAFQACCIGLANSWVIRALGTSAPQSCWLYLGLGIRSLQQRGEHRRKRTEKFDPEDESWKRAFWSFFSLDRLVCLFLGRPAGLHTEDYDVELPLDVDDEYWGMGFTQPPGKPSLLSYFTYHLRLGEILADALRRLYATKKLRAVMGWSGPEWEQRTVAELDSAMNDWLDSVPNHLRWDPDRTPDVFFMQSAVLYATYYSIQIAIHRPYIHQPNILAPPSLSICTNAARSTLHIADSWLNKVQRMPLPFLLNPVFVSGVILMLNIFGNKRAGLLTSTNKDLLLVETAIDFHRWAESRWQPAGRVRELLQELKSLDGPFPLRQPPQNEPQVDDLQVGVPEPGIAFAEATSEGVGELYPSQPIPWNNMHNNSARVSVEQLLADTAEFDTVNLSSSSAGNTFVVPNKNLDDELMSLWMAAPTDFTSIGQWDAYIGTGMTDIDWSDVPAG